MIKIRLVVSFFGCIATTLLASSEPASPPTTLFPAIRAGDRAAVGALLKGGADIYARNESGETPLMEAALNADAALLDLLLKAGAEVNATNNAGATALMRAATFGEKARLLVSHRAAVEIRSALGNTALMLAARQYGNVQTVRLLLDHGADANATNRFGATALMAAVAADDADMVRLLLDHGADVNSKPQMDQDGFLFGGGRTPLMWAAFRNNESIIKLLIARGANVNDFTPMGSALTHAAWAGNAIAARILLEAGAEVDQRDLVANYTPLHWAASSERADARLVELLLAKGADPNAEGGQPVDAFLGVTQTPMKLAHKRGETPIVQALRNAGAHNLLFKDEKQPSKRARAWANPNDDRMVADAIQLAVAPLQKTAVESPVTFLKHVSNQDCVSCHQQELPLAAISLAQSRQIPVDARCVRQQINGVEKFAARFQELELEALFTPEPAVGNGYSLFSLRLQNQPSSALTDCQVHELAVIQCPDGRWAFNLPRPPIQSSDIGATALAVQALKFYGIPGRQAEFARRIERARAWLSKAKAESNEERIYQLLGLAWAGERPGKLKGLAKALLEEQRSDGGWGQLATLPSDAFATGQSVYALLQSGALSAKDPPIQEGLGFLLRTQLEDGTWHVRRRTFPFQPPMESSFPHGADGWISSAGTSWAVLAMASALVRSQTPPPPAALASASKPADHPGGASAPTAAASGIAAAADTTPPHVDFSKDIQPLLERSCVACHSGERAKGGLQMVDRASLLHGGKRGEPEIVASHSDQSPLIRFVSDEVEDLEMPPLGKREKFPPLTKEEVVRLRAWIDQGAGWPKGTTLQASRK